MRLVIFIVLISSAISCGKVNHRVGGEVSAKASTEHSLWINYQKAFDSWIYICDNLYKEQYDNFKCRKEAADRIATMLTLNIQDISKVQEQIESLTEELENGE